MSTQPFKKYSLSSLLLALTLLLTAAGNGRAVGDMEELIPPGSCGAGWKIEGKPLFYNRETLSDRINGEAELYFPYGFDRMAAARYASEKNPGAGIDVEIYRMGSLLDALGMYANYRQQRGQALAIGAAANLSPFQLFLYQGRHFIHIQLTGATDADADALAACGATVAARLPGAKNGPPELSVLDRPEVIKGTERYLPQSLLGYDFLNKGVVADAVVAGGNLQLFYLVAATDKTTAAAFDRFRSLVSQAKVEPVGKNGAFLEGVDPLYGPIVLIRQGSCLAGALKFSGKKGIRALLESVCR